MTIQYKPSREIEKEYDKRARLMIRGDIENRADLKNNWRDLWDLDVLMAKEGEP